MRGEARFDYPNENGMILQLAMEEILGCEGVDAVVRQAAMLHPTEGPAGKAPGSGLPYFQVQALQPTLQKMHGDQAGQGITLQIGRACFKYCLRALGAEYGLMDPDFHLLPLPKRLTKGNEALAGLFRTLTGQRVHLKQANGSIEWVLEAGNGGATGSEVGMLALGLLREAFYWLSAGKTIQVERKSDLASEGRACTIVIDKTPK